MKLIQIDLYDQFHSWKEKMWLNLDSIAYINENWDDINGEFHRITYVGGETDLIKAEDGSKLIDKYGIGTI